MADRGDLEAGEGPGGPNNRDPVVGGDGGDTTGQAGARRRVGRGMRNKGEVQEGDAAQNAVVGTDVPSQPTHGKDESSSGGGIEMGNIAGDKEPRRSAGGVVRRDNKNEEDDTPSKPGGRREDDSKPRDKERGDGDKGDKDREKETPPDLSKTNTGSQLLKVLEPARTDPIKVLQTRQRRIERLSATAMPEVHIVGQITSGRHLITDPGEGACVRWKIEHGKAWQHLGGEILGQTHVAYPQMLTSECVPFNHPIDLHFAESGLQGFGALRMCIQTYKMDSYGRRVLNGYGFVHLPIVPGFHRLEAKLWRPAGSPEAEVDAMMLGRVPALITSDPLYATAWRERCRLVTVGAGEVFLEVYVMTRFMKQQGIDGSTA